MPDESQWPRDARDSEDAGGGRRRQGSHRTHGLSSPNKDAGRHSAGSEGHSGLT